MSGANSGKKKLLFNVGEGKERETENARVWIGFLGFSGVDVLKRWVLAWHWLGLENTSLRFLGVLSVFVAFFALLIS